MSLRSNVLNYPEVYPSNRARLSSLSSVQHPSYNNDSDIVSTKTITVVDPNGITQSVTTETIRALPDGSSVVEKTTQFSRPNSRCNSARSHSRTNTMQDKYNMSRIDEELNNFAYSYLDQRTPSINKTNQSQTNYDYFTNTEAFSGIKTADETENYSLKVEETEKRLKSILKKTPDLVPSSESKSTASSDEDNLSSSYFSLKAPHANLSQCVKDNSHTSEYSEKSLKLPSTKLPEAKINLGATGESSATKIKFAPNTMQSRRNGSITSNLQGRNVPTKATDGKNQEQNEDGLRNGYVYHNHYRKFKAHSLRSHGESHTSVNKPSIRETNRPKKDYASGKHESTELETGMNRNQESLSRQNSQSQRVDPNVGLMEPDTEKGFETFSKLTGDGDSSPRSEGKQKNSSASSFTNGLQESPTKKKSLGESSQAISQDESKRISHSTEASPKKGRFKAFVNKFISK